ncbi:MAG: glycerophosphodiester phosphodiesterase [Dehalococcoidia bacterium]
MGVTRILHAAGNYRESLPLAQLAEVDAIEADVWLHAGDIFVNHARPLGPIPYTLGTDGLRRHDADRVNVAELLAAVDGCAQLVLDLRSWFGDPAPDMMRILHPLRDRSHLLVSCESWAIADRMRVWLPDVRVAYSVRSEGQLRRYVQGRMGGRLPPTAVMVRHTLLRSAAEVESLRRWADGVGVWTVDDLGRATQLVAWGVDSVTSNELSVLAALG